MINICINRKKSKARLTELQNKYDVDSEVLETAIYTWANANEDTVQTEGIDVTRKDLEDFLDDYFKINATKYCSKEKSYNNALAWYNKYNGYKRIKEENARKIYDKLINAGFAEEDITIYKSSDGKFKIVIAKPVNKKVEEVVHTTASKEEINKTSWARTADPDKSYEVSTAGDKRFSALNAKFKKGTIIDGVDVSGMTIENVYQSIIKKSAQGKSPSKDSIINLDRKKSNGEPAWFNTAKELLPIELWHKLYGIYAGNYEAMGIPNPKITKEDMEDFSYYMGYLPLWQEWARQNPDLMQELRKKSEGKTLTDKFANTRVSQARALSDILNEANANTSETQLDTLATIKSIDLKGTYSYRYTTLVKSGLIDPVWSNANGREILVANINETKVLFYKSSHGTDGKKPGNWYPIFGFGAGSRSAGKTSDNDWLIKGTLEQLENGYGVTELQEMQKLLNKAFGWEPGDMMDRTKHAIFTGELLSPEDLNIMVLGKADSGVKNGVNATQFIKQQLSKIKANDFSLETKNGKSLVEKALNKLNTVRQLFADRIRFDKEKHIYYIYKSKSDKDNNVNATVATSVSNYLYGKRDIKFWGTPSSTIGNTNDAITRDYFKSKTDSSFKMKDSYPNMTSA
jgi:hypothetical protein